MNKENITKEYLLKRVGVFDDSAELSEALRDLPEELGLSLGDAYYFDECSWHIDGMWTLINEFKVFLKGE
jgi:hypothetical protein